MFIFKKIVLPCILINAPRTTSLHFTCGPTARGKGPGGMPLPSAK